MQNVLKIGYDAKRLFYNNTGLGNYSRDLIRALRKYYPDNSYLLFSQFQSKSKHSSDFEEHLYATISQSKLWRQWHIHKDITASSIDIFHGLSAELPLSIRRNQVAKVVTIHDLIFKKFPQWYSAVDRKIYDFKSRYACQHADVVIAISERTKQDIMDFYNIDSDKIQVVYQNCSDMFRIISDDDSMQVVRKKYNLPDHYILSVGRIETRKNLMTVARAMNLIDEDVHWVCVGKDYGEKNNILSFVQKNNLTHRVHILEDIPSDDLVLMYNYCISSVYVSLYEGFGIPVLEAMRCGVPVIASDSSCLHEVAGSDGLYIQPEDFSSLSAHVNRMYHESDDRQKIIDSQLIQSRKFSEYKFASDTMAIYQKLVH